MSIGSHNTLGATPVRARCGVRPTEPKGLLFVVALAFAQLTLFIALLGPVMVSMALKVNTLTDNATEQTTVIGNVLGAGALAAVVGNALFGRLSDRTTSRFGRRRPWMIGGIVAMAAAMLLLALATAPWMLGVGWFLAQLGANAAFSPYMATLADQLPEEQYARVSAVVGIMQNVGILGATWFASLFSQNMLLLFMVPALVGVVGMVLYALILDDPVLDTKPPRLSFRQLVESFWVNPIRFPNFGLVWWQRFFVILSSFLFTTFRLPFVMHRLGVKAPDGAGVVFKGVLVYTITLVAVAYVAGWISDRTGSRKIPVAISAMLFGVGTYLLMHVSTVGQFYLVEALIGAGYGIYMAVDMALVLSVLPNPDNNARDLGVFNMANAIPQSFAPFLGAWLLATGTADNPNYALLLGVAAAAAVAGALVVLPVRKVN